MLHIVCMQGVQQARPRLFVLLCCLSIDGCNCRCRCGILIVARKRRLQTVSDSLCPGVQHRLPGHEELIQLCKRPMCHFWRHAAAFENNQWLGL